MSRLNIPRLLATLILLTVVLGVLFSSFQSHPGPALPTATPTTPPGVVDTYKLLDPVLTSTQCGEFGFAGGNVEEFVFFESAGNGSVILINSKGSYEVEAGSRIYNLVDCDLGESVENIILAFGEVVSIGQKEVKVLMYDKSRRPDPDEKVILEMPYSTAEGLEMYYRDSTLQTVQIPGCGLVTIDLGFAPSGVHDNLRDKLLHPGDEIVEVCPQDGKEITMGKLTHWYNEYLWYFAFVLYDRAMRGPYYVGP